MPLQFRAAIVKVSAFVRKNRFKILFTSEILILIREYIRNNCIFLNISVSSPDFYGASHAEPLTEYGRHVLTS